MKKKIAAVLLLSTLIASTVSASSINGNYNGNPIVKVRSNGITVESEVPAQIINETTMLPLRAISTALGVGLTWNEDTYSVDLEMNKTISESYSDAKEFKEFVSNIKASFLKSGISVVDYTINTDEIGTYAYVRYNSDNLSTDKIYSDLVVLSSMAALPNFSLDGTVIEIMKNKQISIVTTINIDDSKNFLNKKITVNEYTTKWDIQTISDNLTIPSSTNSPIQSNNSSYCASLIQQYDYEKRMVEESYGASGFGRSSIVKDKLQKIEEDKNSALKSNGCIQ